jgi:hypothetical protein
MPVALMTNPSLFEFWESSPRSTACRSDELAHSHNVFICSALAVQTKKAHPILVPAHRAYCCVPVCCVHAARTYSPAP